MKTGSHPNTAMPWRCVPVKRVNEVFVGCSFVIFGERQHYTAQTGESSFVKKQCRLPINIELARAQNDVSKTHT